MEFLLFTKEELKKLYEERMSVDFPDAELKPLGAIYRMMDEKHYDPLAVYDEGTLVGYALMTKLQDEGCLLLDYLAVFKEYRKEGYGSRILDMLKKRYSGMVIFIESENPDFQQGEAKNVAEKRISFYQKNGVADTGVLTKIWTVPYINFYLSDRVFTEKECREILIKIYNIMVPEEDVRQKMIEIPQRL